MTKRARYSPSVTPAPQTTWYRAGLRDRSGWIGLRAGYGRHSQTAVTRSLVGPADIRLLRSTQVAPFLAIAVGVSGSGIAIPKLCGERFHAGISLSTRSPSVPSSEDTNERFPE
jgi:hypothetical protein